MYFLKADSDKFFGVSAKMVEHTVSYISLQLTVLTKVVLGHLPARGIAPLHLEKKKKKKSGAGGFLISGDLASDLRWADIFANEWAAGLRRGEQIKKKTCQKLAIGTTAANIKKKKRKKKRNLSSITSCSSTGKTLPGLSTLCRSNTMTPSLYTYCICTTLKASMAADQKQQRQCLTFM